MGWLGDALKAIILVILLAIFVDMLIPGKAMQRYVKVVISLFILMTILHPVIRLLNAEFDIEKLQLPDSPFDTELASYTPLADVLQEGDELREQNLRRSLELTRAHIEETIQRELSPLIGEELVQVTATIVPEDGGVRFDAIEITVGGGEANEGERPRAPPASPSPIADVRPIEVSIEWANPELKYPERSDALGKLQPEQDDSADRRWIEETAKRYLQENWHLSAEQIRILYAGKTDRG